MPSTRNRHSSSLAARIVSVIFVSILSTALAQEPATNSPAEPAMTGDRITIGKITVDKRERTIQFPATVNLANGMLEYLLVTNQGKTHESLFATTVSPFQMHVAMLLLGVKPTRETAQLPPEHLSMDYVRGAPESKGDEVDVLVSWKQGANEQKIHGEEWVNNSVSKAPMTKGPWIYTGSVLYNKQFLAQVDGSIVALVTDPVALINNPRPGHDDNTIWSVRSDKVPPVGTPVTITFQLAATKSKP